MPPAHERRIKLLRISVPMLPLLFQAGSRWTLVKHPLPEDARFLRWYFDGECKDLVVTVWSESFPEIPVGGSILDLDPPLFHETKGDS